MGGACDIGWGTEKCIQFLGGENSSEKRPFGRLGHRQGVILKWILNK
jgi:hypothetical protein